jgi:hypothetical protein
MGAVRTEQGSITVTPTHARRIVLSLTEAMAEYEKHIGPIPSEPNSPIDFSGMAERISSAVKSKVTK